MSGRSNGIGASATPTSGVPLRRRRAVSWVATVVVVLAGTSVPVAPAQTATPVRAAAAAQVGPSCGTTGTDLGGSGCRYATVGTDTFRAPYYQPEITFTVYGARSQGRARLGGWGGMSKGTLAVTPGATFQVNVGGPAGGASRAQGGFNGGGDGGSGFATDAFGLSTGGLGGGGASDVREGAFGLLDRLVVGGGGGGFGGGGFSSLIAGGAGGGLAGNQGDSGIGSEGGGGGTQSAAGRSPGNAGSAGRGVGGTGGDGDGALANPGAGGGGGWFGGGGSGVVAGAVAPSGGGGGSGYITPRATDNESETGGQIRAYPVPADETEFGGELDGRGLVLATWPGGPVTATVALTSNRPSPVAAADVIDLTTTVTTSTGVAPVGSVRFIDFTNARGSSNPSAPGDCPCFDITGDVIDETQNGTTVTSIRAGSLRGGPEHTIVAIFEDQFGEIETTRSAPLAFRVTGATGAGVDLEINQTDVPGPVTIGSDITYTLAVTNKSANRATSVEAVDLTRDGVTFKAAGSSPNCTKPFDVVVCDLGEVAAGATETVTVVVTADRLGEITNAVSVEGAEPDPDGSNNLSTITTQVVAAPTVPGVLGFSMADHPVQEGDTATVTVTRGGGSDGAVSVGYRTGDGTAVAPGDYPPTSGTVAFAAGETSKAFDVVTVEDTEVEPDETITLTLSNPTGGATIGTADATVTIGNDDRENLTPTLTAIPAQSVRFGNPLSFTATAADADVPAQALTFSLVAPPAGATIDPSTGVVGFTPTAAQIGAQSIVVRVTDDGSPNRSAETTVAVTVEKRPTTVVYSGASSGQFSDPVTVRATLTDNGGGALQGTALAGRNVGFAIGDRTATAATDGAGLAQATLTLDRSVGNPGVGSSFAGDSTHLASTDADPFTVAVENATLAFAGPGLSVRLGAPVNLTARVSEAADGSPGNQLDQTQLRFTVRRSANNAVVATCTAPVTAATAGAGTGTCGVRLPLLGVYRVIVEMVPNARYGAGPVTGSNISVALR